MGITMKRLCAFLGGTLVAGTMAACGGAERCITTSVAAAAMLAKLPVASTAAISATLRRERCCGAVFSRCAL